MPIPTVGYAAQDVGGVLQPWKFEHPDLGPLDVHIRIVACGICQADIHFGRNDWGTSTYPCVPGHEITGYVEAVGREVTKVKRGDKTGVGILIDTCGSCLECTQSMEQYCAQRVFLGNGKLIKDGSPSFGGYARDIVCQERFICRFPKALDLYTGAPLLCAGISVYSAMKQFGMDKPGKKVGVIGLGGLGHMAVKFGVAFDLQVTVLSHSESKRKEATSVLGAIKFLNTMDKETFADSKLSLDFILDTVGNSKDMDAYLSLLRVDGVYVMLGVAEKPIQFNNMSILNCRRILAGSIVGSIAETEEMLKFCAERNIFPMIEKIKMDYVNTAWERVLNSDVRYRFVLDVENSCPDECCLVFSCPAEC